MLKDRIYAIHRGLYSAWARRRLAADFAGVKTFCLFVGYPRSGHSLVGALLNAHRDAVISHELNAPALIRSGCSRDELYARILARAHWFNLRSNTSNYRYQVPRQWQGRFQTLQVIGDKQGGALSRFLKEDPGLLDRVRSLTGVPLRLIHVARNPFDNISAISISDGRTLQESIDYYFLHCQVTRRLDQFCEPGELITVHHEEMIRDPRATIAALCQFLGLSPERDYLEDCSGIVYGSPSFTRSKIAWTESAVRETAKRFEEIPFLQHYTFD